MDAARLKTILEDLEQTLLAFMRKHDINHYDYRAATSMMVATVKAGEESLLPDVLFEAESTNIGNKQRRGSGEAIEGPFYIADAPLLSAPAMLPHRPDEKGDVLIFKGRVVSDNGEPIPGAEIDLWQADADGLYSNIHPGIPDFNLRGRFHADGNGSYEVRTIVPPPYEIPKNGPTGRILTAMGRHFFRPAHLHAKIRHPDHGEMTSQIYFTGDEYLGSDVANAVRDDLIIDLVKNDQKEAMAERGLTKPFYEASFDFVL